MGIEFPNLTIKEASEIWVAREIEQTIDRMLKQGKVVLVTGARQVGKTTVLREHFGSSFDYVTMEDPAAYAQAKSDAVLFFEMHSLPLVVDEVQRVPELFSPVKWLSTSRQRRVASCSRDRRPTIS